jgi:hypothetical protein
LAGSAFGHNTACRVSYCGVVSLYQQCTRRCYYCLNFLLRCQSQSREWCLYRCYILAGHRFSLLRRLLFLLWWSRRYSLYELQAPAHCCAVSNPSPTAAHVGQDNNSLVSPPSGSSSGMELNYVVWQWS